MTARACVADLGPAHLEAAFALGLGWVALMRAQPAGASRHFQDAVSRWGELGVLAEQPVALAWLGAARLGLGDPDGALEATAQAVELVEAGHATTEYDLQDIWWWRHRALRASDGHGTASDNAWHALDRAREAMVAAVATLSDNGLRRSYFSKVAVNRDIIEEWLRQAPKRGLPLAPGHGVESPALRAPRSSSRAC